MIVASMRYGTIRRPTALTTDSFDGFVRHATSIGSSDGIMAAVIRLLHRGISEAPPGFGATHPGPADEQGPTRWGSFVVPWSPYPRVVAPSPTLWNRRCSTRPTCTDERGRARGLHARSTCYVRPRGACRLHRSSNAAPARG